VEPPSRPGALSCAPLEPAGPPAPAPPPGHAPLGAAAPGPAPAPRPPPAPARLAVPLAATFLVLQAGLLVVAQAAQRLQPGAGLVWYQVFGFALPAAALAALAGLAPAPFLRLVLPAPRALGLALVVGALALLVGGALQALWASALPEPLLRAYDVARLFRRAPWERTLLVASATVLAPVCEELAFRGHLLSALQLRLRPGAAIGLSALAFAALHLDPVRLPGLLFLGVLYGWLTWRSGSIYPAVLAHAVNNAAAMAQALGGDAAERVAPDATGAAAALLVGLALLAPALLAYQRWLPPAPGPAALLVPGPARPGRLPRWAAVAAWAAVVSLVLIALAPRP
jgi:CAAX protease family protein